MGEGGVVSKPRTMWVTQTQCVDYRSRKAAWAGCGSAEVRRGEAVSGALPRFPDLLARPGPRPFVGDHVVEAGGRVRCSAGS